jgi:TPR repeat protein
MRVDDWHEPFYEALAHMFSEKRDTPGYIRALERGARAGDDHAAYALGSAYLHGLYKPTFRWKKDRRRGLALIRRATRSVHMAMTELASFYESGEHGLRKSEKRAFQLFARAVEYGSIVARFHLGRCYYLGVGTKPDRRKGMALIRASARLGFPAYDQPDGADT